MGDFLYLVYYLVFWRGDYEDAVQALVNGLLFGLPLLGALTALLFVYFSKPKKSRKGML